MNYKLFLAALCVSACTVSLEASTVTSTLPEFNGIFNSTGPYPATSVDVGTFTFSLPNGEQVVSATLTGTYGNSAVPNSAGLDLYGDGQFLGQCLANALCDTNPEAVTPFSYTLNSASFGLLTDGAFRISAIQTSGNVIRLGAETLTIQTSASSVPEPGSVALLGVGLLAISLGTRRRFWK